MATLRTKSIKIRVTEDELKQLRANRGNQQLARWLRDLGLGASSGHQEEVIKHQLPPELVRNLAGIGGNVNQIARHLNTSAKSGDPNLLMVATKLMTQLTAVERALNSVRDYLDHDS